MGKIKEKFQEIAEIIQAQLDLGINYKELDNYMKDELSLSDYAFYLENKSQIINFLPSFNESLLLENAEENDINFNSFLNPKDYISIIVLDERPIDPLDKLQYKVLLTKKKEFETYGFEWGLSIIYKLPHWEQWKLIKGQWDLEVLINFYEKPLAQEQDKLFIDIERNWYVTNMKAVIEEAAVRVENEER